MGQLHTPISLVFPLIHLLGSTTFSRGQRVVPRNGLL